MSKLRQDAVCSGATATVDIADLKQMLADRAPAVAEHLLPGGHREKHEWRAGSIFGEPGNSLAVRLNGPKAGTWSDFAAGEKNGSKSLIDLWMAARRVDLPTALKEICAWLGVDEGRRDRPETLRRRNVLPTPTRQTIDNSWQPIWRETVDLLNSPAEAYLLGRLGRLPGDLADLRFHPACPRGHDRLPAMVALMRAAENSDPKVESNQPTGIHRTFLTKRPDGTWDKANVEPVKMMLGRATGSVVKLTSDEDVTFGLGLSEGIEDGLAIIKSGWCPVWACLSAGGMSAFPVLHGIEAITAFCDADSPGRKAAAAVVERWRQAGKEATIAEPPPGIKDFGELNA